MNLIEKLSDKEYIKKLNSQNSSLVCSEIRRFLIDNVMKTGGHLASNLGVVELTLAMHKVFDFPNDKVVFDVGHQSYVHKILSGRYNEFSTLRQLNGMSGFPKREESEYDSFDTGHSSTSISAALGIAKGRDLNNENFNVIAFIGDGALGGGMAFEAMNDAGASETKLIIILNDNEMSISKNVGGLSAHLSMLRIDKGYLNAKNKMHNLLKKTGSVGNKITKLIKDTKNAIKYATLEAPMFEDLGITYIGIIDGHNIDDLTNAFENAKHINGPVLIHTYTVKGKGYKPAEENPAAFHGIGPDFNKKSDEKKELTYSQLLGNYLIKKAETNQKLVAITAAMRSGCGLGEYSKLYHERFFDVGIAEQHAVTFAGGLATQNITPVVCIYSTFLQRAYDQILHDICLQNLHVVFAVDRAGIVGNDGETHQGIFDFSYLIHIPNITVFAPTCEKEFNQMMDYAIDVATGPVAIRYPRELITKRECSDFEVGKSEFIDYNNNDILIIGIGRMLNCAVETMNLLKSSGYSVGVINIRCLKPIDFKRLNQITKKSKLIVTIEDNVIAGGAGEYIASVCERENRGKFINFGYDDCFIKQGKPFELFEKYGLTPDIISKRIKEEMLKYEKQT